MQENKKTPVTLNDSLSKMDQILHGEVWRREPYETQIM